MAISKAEELARNLRYLNYALTEEELNAIDDILVNALIRIGSEIRETLEGVSLD